MWPRQQLPSQSGQLPWASHPEGMLLGCRELAVKWPGQLQEALTHTLPASPSESWRLWMPRPGPRPSPLHSWVSLRIGVPCSEHQSSGPFSCCCCCQMLMGVWEARRNVFILGQVEIGLQDTTWPEVTASRASGPPPGVGSALPAPSSRSIHRLLQAPVSPFIKKGIKVGPTSQGLED